MEEKQLLKQLKKGDQSALEIIMHNYTGYVSAVTANQLGAFVSEETVEELASDVFFALWKNRRAIKACRLRGWLASAARNKARSYLRAFKVPCDELEEDSIIIDDGSVFVSLERNEQRRAVENALKNIGADSREIMVRHYYYNQTTACIAEEMNLNRETVKSRLKRGREKLKTLLEQGGYIQ
jgi:RNA polymerase sigma-70 factor (ECF subfamily)